MCLCWWQTARLYWVYWKTVPAGILSYQTLVFLSFQLWVLTGISKHNSACKHRCLMSLATAGTASEGIRGAWANPIYTSQRTSCMNSHLDFFTLSPALSRRLKTSSSVLRCASLEAPVMRMSSRYYLCPVGCSLSHAEKCLGLTRYCALA